MDNQNLTSSPTLDAPTSTSATSTAADQLPSTSSPTLDAATSDSATDAATIQLSALTLHTPPTFTTPSQLADFSRPFTYQPSSFRITISLPPVPVPDPVVVEGLSHDSLDETIMPHNSTAKPTRTAFIALLNDWMAQLLQTSLQGLRLIIFHVEGGLCNEVLWMPMMRFLSRVVFWIQKKGEDQEGTSKEGNVRRMKCGIRVEGVRDFWGYRKEILKPKMGSLGEVSVEIV
jgi:hypothetical protein